MAFFDFLNPLKILTDPITAITKAIADVKLAQAQALTDKENIAAEERVKSLEARRDVLIAESGNSLNRTIRTFLALPVVFLLWKIIVFDNIFGAWLNWSTPELSDNVWYIVMLIITFYFVDSIASRFKR